MCKLHNVLTALNKTSKINFYLLPRVHTAAVHTGTKELNIWQLHHK